MTGPIEPPFGTHALPAPLERLRATGAGLPRGWLTRRITSLIRRVCVAGRSDPFDIRPFPGQAARLYPRDNLSEKRVFCAPQFWDWTERAALAQAMQERPAPFHFVDAGANVGLYTLALRSHGPVRGLAIEPDPENLRRLRANLAASGARDSVAVAGVALSHSEGKAILGGDTGNRGEIALGSGTGVAVLTRPLFAVVQWAGLPRIDALKIDIEGLEEPVLRAFFSDAPVSLWPALIVIEAQRGAETPALALLRQNGYVKHGRTKMNVMMAAPEGGWPDRTKGNG